MENYLTKTKIEKQTSFNTYSFLAKVKRKFTQATLYSLQKVDKFLEFMVIGQWK